MRRASKWGLIAMAAVLGLMTTAMADQTISWVSVSATGDGGSLELAASDDGRFVAFHSAATELVPNDTNSTNDVFVRDMETGTLALVSVSSSEDSGNSSSGIYSVDISDDGRFVLFDSTATNLVPGDTNGRPDLFVHDMQTGETERVVRGDGTEGGGARWGSISGNGRYVAFPGDDYDEVANTGMFVLDRQTEEVERIQDGTLFLNPPGADVGISDDGRFLAFRASDFTSQWDIILFDRDTDTWEIANPRIGGAEPQSRPPFLDLSGDGRFVAFGSPDNNLVAGDSGTTNDVFVYDSGTDSLERILGGGDGNDRPNPVLSDSGQYVAYVTWADIYGAANGVTDVVVYDRQTDTGAVVSLHNDGTAAERASGTYLREPAISGDGRFVALQSSEKFHPDAGDNQIWLVDREGTTPPPPPPGGCSVDFTDVDASNIFEDDICWLAEQGITRGCNPPANTEFCPTDPVTRGQMAAFLVRALDYTDNGGGDLFTDDDGLVFEGDIDRLGTAGVTRGCNPPANTEFCPGDNVTRGQMAAFLVRALGYTDNGGGDLFTDDDGLVFEGDIDRLGTAGVTRGCNPPANTQFCPAADVTRQQMAAFLRRALEG